MVILLPGCASQIAFNIEKAQYVENKCNKVYIGVRESIGLANSNGHSAGLGIIVLPGTLIGDTLLLPYSIPVSIKNLFSCNFNKKKYNST